MRLGCRPRPVAVGWLAVLWLLGSAVGSSPFAATDALAPPRAEKTTTTTTTTTSRPVAVPASVPASVDATGAADVTAGLQAFVDAVPDGATVRLQRGGVYRVEGTLVLSGRRNLTIDGNGARLFATTAGVRDRAHLRVLGGSGLVVHDLEIVGANANAGTGELAYDPTLAFQHGIDLEGATDVELTRIRVSSVYGDFVYLGRSDHGQWSERVWIHDSVFSGSGRQGLTVAAGRDVVIEHNYIAETRRATVDLEPNGATWGAQNVHILDNVVGPGRLLFVAAAGAGPVDDVVVARNQLRGRSLTMVIRAPSGGRYKNVFVSGNTTDVPVHRPPLAFGAVSDLVVVGNTIPIDAAGVAAVVTDNVCGLVVAGNVTTPGTLQLAPRTTICEQAPPATTLPAVPAVAGRPVSAAPPPTSSTTTTTRSTRTDAGSVGAPTGPARGPGDPTSTALLVAVALVAFVALAGVGAWTLRRRSAQRQREASTDASRSA